MKTFCSNLRCLLARASDSLFAIVKQRPLGLLLATLLITLYAGSNSAWAASSTTTTLAVTSGGSAVTTVASPSVVTLTATVLAGSTPVTVGQVNFCDASVAYCTDIHILATAQLASAGTATYKFRPAPGSHSYKAVFRGTTTDATSSSSVSGLSVSATGPYSPSNMELAATINPSNAAESTLTATLPRLGPIQPAPTGTISFIDSNHGDALLGSAALGADSSVIGLGTLLGFSTNFDNIPFSAEGGLAIGDFNGDGIPDLAVSGEGFSSQQQSGIYLGKGDGTFTLDTAGPGLFSPILVADFNGDGNADILAGGSVFLGNGGGRSQL